MNFSDWIKESKGDALFAIGIGVLIFAVGHFSKSSIDEFFLLLLSIFASLIWYVSSFFWSSLKKIHLMLDKTNIILGLLVESSEKENDLTSARIKQILNDGKCIIDKPDVPSAWLSLSWGIRKEYLSVSYAVPEDAYENEGSKENWSNTGIEIQNLKSTSGQASGIQKIYVVDDEKELTYSPLKEVLSQHIDSKISIYYILNKDIENNDELSKSKAGIPSIDFSIVDNEHIFVWNLCVDRRISSAERIFSDSSVRIHSDFFGKLYRASRVINPETLCEMERKYA